MPKKQGTFTILADMFFNNISHCLSGQDPILGAPSEAKVIPLGGTAASFTNGGQVDLKLTGKDGKTIELSGFPKVTVTSAVPPPGEDNPFFVTSRGGEYFFVPSVSTLKYWANSGDVGPTKL